MDWSGIRNSRLVAGLYLVAFAGLYGGVACVLAAQWTGQQRLAVGGLVLVGGLITIVALAWGLRGRVPARAGRLTARASKHTRAYQRLTLGLELGRAWRVLTK